MPSIAAEKDGQTASTVVRHRMVHSLNGHVGASLLPELSIPLPGLMIGCAPGRGVVGYPAAEQDGDTTRAVIGDRRAVACGRDVESECPCVAVPLPRLALDVTGRPSE